MSWATRIPLYKTKGISPSFTNSRVTQPLNEGWIWVAVAMINPVLPHVDLPHIEAEILSGKEIYSCVAPKTN